MWGNEYEKIKQARRRRKVTVVLVLLAVGLVASPFLVGYFGVPAEDRALDRAIASGNTEAARQALDNGADPNRLNRRGRTPLHEAAWAGHEEIARLLVRHGADVEARERKAGEAPLHTAVRANQPGMVILLLGAGASARVTTLDETEPCVAGIRHPPGSTPMDIAQRSGFTVVERRLRGE